MEVEPTIERPTLTRVLSEQTERMPIRFFSFGLTTPG